MGLRAALGEDGGVQQLQTVIDLAYEAWGAEFLQWLKRLREVEH